MKRSRILSGDWFKTNHYYRAAFLGGMLLGAVCFVLIYGVKVLNPTFDDFLLMDGGDLSQHYIGWMYYRSSPWQFPIGLTENLIYPLKISIMYTDSIPLFAVLFKILSPLLPSTFQYFGLFGIISFMLQGGFASIILRKFTDNYLFCYVGSLFFIVSPIVLLRMLAHTALAAQWILLASLAIWVHQDRFEGTLKSCIAWSVLLFLAPLIQSYFVPLVMIFLCGAQLDWALRWKKIKKALLVFLSASFSGLLAMFLIGAFYGSVSASTDGIAYYNANLNFLWNPINSNYSLLLNPFPVATSGQYEGLGYLGVGLILLGLTAIGLLFYKKMKTPQKQQKRNTKKQQKSSIGPFLQVYSTQISTVTVLVLGVILACGTLISFNKWSFEIPYPDFITRVWEIFRSTGRFVWILWYVFAVYIMKWIAGNTSKSVASMLICAAACVQLLDMQAPIRFHQNRLSSNTVYENKVDTPIWDTLFEGHEHVVFLTPHRVVTHDFPLYDIAVRANSEGLTINNFHTSRPIWETVEPLVKESRQNPQEDTIYIAPYLGQYFWLRQMGLYVYQISDMYVGVTSPLGEDAAEYQVNQVDSVIISMNTDQYLLQGTVQEDGRTVLPGGISYGPYVDLSPGNYQLSISGKNLDPTTFDILCDLSTLHEFSVVESSSESMVISFSMNADTPKVEFRIVNRTDREIMIHSMMLTYTLN